MCTPGEISTVPMATATGENGAVIRHHVTSAEADAARAHAATATGGRTGIAEKEKEELGRGALSLRDRCEDSV